MFLSAAFLWLLAGCLLCVLELFVPTALAEFLMGISAIAVSLVIWLLPGLQNAWGIQIAIWMILSVTLIYLVRTLSRGQKSPILEDAKEAETITEILPGQPGRVLYEGNSWQARCDDEMLTIEAKQKVYIVRRQGTTLFVMPETVIK